MVLSIIIAVFLVTFMIMFVNGKGDPYYLKVASPKQNSLIVGTSRAAQGLIPEVINNSAIDFNKPIYNFSFTMTNSPYGKSYLEAIKKKTKTSIQNNGLFILEVSPLSISFNKVTSPNEEEDEFREVNNFLSKISSVSEKPNFEYLLKYYPHAYYKMILRNFRKQMILQEDGWLKINISMDSARVQKRKEGKYRAYKEQFKKHSFSSIRERYLNETIDYLSNLGAVYLVRLPLGKEMYQMEQEYMPSFDKKMEEIARKKQVVYINIAPESKAYQTTDGNHLHKKSARKVTQELIKSMIE